MAGRLADKIALITGGGSGIGRACALAFAREGAHVAVADLDGARAQAVAKEVEGAGRRAIALAVDTTDEAANDAMVERAVAALGGLDVLVAAAGVGSPRRASTQTDEPHTVLSIPTSDFRAVLDVNLWGVFHGNRAAARWMQANSRRGSLINLGSIMSKMPSRGGAYSVSKAGVWMLTKCLAQELAPHGIRVNAVAPTFVDTELGRLTLDRPGARDAITARIPLGRVATPQEVAAAVRHLASAEAAFTTGTVLPIDGGLTMR